MKDILAIIPHGNVKSELVKFFSQYQRDFFPIFPVCIPLCGADFATQDNSEIHADSLWEAEQSSKKLISLKELKPLFSKMKITLKNLQIANMSAPETVLGFGGENAQENWNNTKIAVLSVDCPNFQNIPFLKNKNLFLPLGFLKSTSDSLEIDIKTDFKIDFKIFQLVHLRFEKQKSPKSANEPTLSFSYKILDSVWCK